MTEPQTRRESKIDNLEKQLDPSAKAAFQELASVLREALLFEARGVSSSDCITDHDLYFAYKKLSYPDKGALQFADAQTVISQALRENQVV
jgi:hypothetical protein